jgi:TFIIF-interacting CTD phosphatase-like protein
MLEDLKSTFTMYIYTMGTKAYAEEVKKILDPCGVIFGKRVLSRCDTPDLSIKLLSKLKLADTDTLIVDDTPEVWSEHRRNLLQIDRYTFFPLRADELCFFSRKMRTRGTIWHLFIRLCKEWAMNTTTPPRWTVGTRWPG